MVIIAESGATKTDWCSVSETGERYSLKTPGMNVSTGEKVNEIHFYAAGLISDGKSVPESAKRLDDEFRKAFPDAQIEYASDLLDAARAVCGREPGIAVILGTGSNSCEYDGEKIVRNVRSGGFILGDHETDGGDQ